MNTAVIRINNSYGLYDFITDLDLKKGDKVVCETTNGLVVGTVDSVKAGISTKATRWVISIVDTSALDAKKANMQLMKDLETKIKKRIKELQEKYMMEYLCSIDAELALMVKQLNVLRQITK